MLRVLAAIRRLVDDLIFFQITLSASTTAPTPAIVPTIAPMLQLLNPPNRRLNLSGHGGSLGQGERALVGMRSEARHSERGFKLVHPPPAPLLGE
jgi:hypothetical protein